ncbi:amino acid racemase [Sphingorhabdus sp. Alg239-R122]|uniref:aspartate/glutamate racemase family protein n=1 Tax=Sphingorhabdus sp. Alg239-R122 TaxID=2305989 RepID=UPI0013D9D9E7|nr:amino acid racemase [Sphingorhabdus sp. Alg239-R122]
MRKLGLIGGLSWISTSSYYERINLQVRKRVSEMCSAPLAIESLNFCELSRLETAEQWGHASCTLQEAAKRLEGSGATAIVIAANSMHKVYDDVAGAVSVPILHIADCVGEKMKADGVKKAGLLGTRQVMTESFYRQRLIGHGISLIPPHMDRVDGINKTIYEELMLGKTSRDSERLMKTFITDIEKEGADAVILGCTELEMIINTDANILPIYNGARIHADAAVDWILDGA